MIVVKLTGGLGNQMFQYAFGRALSLHYNESVMFDSFDYSIIKSFFQPAYRQMGLDVFNIKCIFLGGIASLVLRLLVKAKILHDFKEKKLFAFDRAVFKEKFDYYVGHWQTEQYFQDIESTLRKDFEFKSKLSGRNKGMANKIIKCNSVSVHIRRGDYLTCGALNLSDLGKYSYYQNAIALVKKKVTNPIFFVFSDDLGWVKENMSVFFKDNVNYIDLNNIKSSYKDMHLISLCKHNIIANSSFSWWGAWLNKNKSKLVIAPKEWCLDKDLRVDDLIPGDWHKI